MNFVNACKQFIVGFITGLLGIVDDDELKAERVQFWKDMIDPAWQRERGGRALVRTIGCVDSAEADHMVKTLTGELESHGYRADALEAAGNVVNVRLTTASVGRLTERDYAAAALIDLVM